MIRGEWVIVYAKSHSRECALPMKAMPLNSLGSLDHGKHKDELCTLNIVHDSHPYCSRMEVVT